MRNSILVKGMVICALVLSGAAVSKALAAEASTGAKASEEVLLVADKGSGQGSQSGKAQQQSAAQPGQKAPQQTQQSRPKPRNLNLGECMGIALEHNYDIKISRNEQRIAENNVTLAPFLPSVGAGAGQDQSYVDSRVKPFDSSEPTVNTNYTGNVFNAQVVLSWTLFDGMAMFATRDIQKELLKQGELNLKNSMENLVADISQQYFFIITQARRLKAARLYLEISTLRYNQAKEKYIIGSISGLEMKQAKIDFNADSSNLVTQQEVLQNCYIQLFEMMNIPLDSKYSINDTIIPNDKLDLELLIETAKINNTSIQLAQRGENLSSLDLRVARSGRYPTLNFGAGYDFNHNQKDVSPTRYTRLYGPSWGFTVSANLFNGFETRRRIRNAQIVVENSTLELRNTELKVISNISQQYNTYLNNIIMINFEIESAESALANLEAAMEMYRLGTMSGVEFREIQRSYLLAEERRIAAIYQAKSSEITLRYLAGNMLTYRPGSAQTE